MYFSGLDRAHFRFKFYFENKREFKPEMKLKEESVKKQ